jgi:hypothetical protein
MKKVFLTSAFIVLLGLLLAGTNSFSQQGKGQGKMGGKSNNSKFVDANGDGICDNFVDANGDGICDSCSNLNGGHHYCGKGKGKGLCNNNYQNNMIQKYEFSDQVVNDFAKVTFNLKESANVKLQVFDRNGNLIENVYSGSLGTGTHSIDINTSNYKTGVYFYTLQINGQSIVREISIVK